MSREVTIKKILFSSIIIFSIIILDQLTKALVVRFLSTTCNTGFAFGIYQGVLNGLVAFLVLGALILAFYREQKRTVYYSLALIIGGGASNILDRLTRGCVVDFITFDFLPRLTWFPLFDVIRSSLTRWPAFNLADAAISVGVAILIISIAAEMKAYQKH